MKGILRGSCKGNYGLPLKGFGVISGRLRVVVLIILAIRA